MRKIALIICMIFPVSQAAFAAPKELEPSALPRDVVETLNAYLTVLSSSASVDEAGNTLLTRGLIGGHLLSTDGTKASSDALQFSLKKDFENVKFYTVPAVITRIILETDSYDGFKKTLFEGARYKIWINKKPGVAGMPAPVPVIKPKSGKPRVVSVVGSL